MLEAQEYDRVPWRAKRVSFVTQQRNVRDFLKEFASSQNLPLSMSDSVRGVVSGVFKDVPTDKLLDALCEANGLVWFYDGVRMNVESADEIISRPLSLPYVSTAALGDVILSLGYASGPPGREIQIKPGHREGIMLIIGGPQFIQATETLARDLDTQENRRVNEQITVRAFRLSYASANDTYVNTGSTNRVIPGVVRNLQNLMANQVPGSALSTGVEETTNRVTRPRLGGTGLAAVGGTSPISDGFNPYDPTGLQAQQLQGQGQARGGSPMSAAGGRGVDPNDPRAPMIVADVRSNSVLVRDVAARMPLYEELIKMLDVPTKAVEITAAVVDIDSNNLRNVGIELLGGGKKGNDKMRLGFDADRGIFDSVNTQGQVPSFFDGSNLARGAGLNATALLSAGGYELLTRLRAVEEVGAAQIVSSPSVLTMENVQAVIRTDEKVYVKVAGNLQVDLFDVTAGIQLRVTPTIIRDPGNTGAPNFRLQIDITDGGFSDQSVDTVPSTRESAINTQAMVPENKTLLLGGYSVERRNRNNRQVPLLAKVPVLGKLFSNNERNHVRSQRFFFITPRIVDLKKEATSSTNFANTTDNELALPSYLSNDELSMSKTEDLARRLAASTQNSAREQAKNGGRGPQNPLLPSQNAIPRAIPLPEDEGVTPAPAPKTTNSSTKSTR